LVTPFDAIIAFFETLSGEPMTVAEAIAQFFFHCQYEKNLSPKTLKAYSIDLRQWSEHLDTDLGVIALSAVDKGALRAYIKSLFNGLAEKSVKRKVATLKALFNFLEREDVIAVNPFRKMDVRIKETRRLPRTVDSGDLKLLFKHLYQLKERYEARRPALYKALVRDIAVLEVLFGTGARVSEVCNLAIPDVDLRAKQLRILGKGARERVLACDKEMLRSLSAYRAAWGEGTEVHRGHQVRLIAERHPRRRFGAVER
jgi:integrase/recombinase XerD